MFNYFGLQDIETSLSTVSLTAAVVGGGLVVILLILAALWQKTAKVKLPLFAAIVVVVLGTTATIAGNTIYLNIKSATGGPVHWHADIEFWACGNELELRDPTGLSNKIGTPTYHEHNDKRIHLEGVPISLPYDFSLSKFMTVIDGSLTDTMLTVPLNATNYFENQEGEDGDGSSAPAPELVNRYIKTDVKGKVASFVTGETCGDQTAEVQAFAYRYNTQDNTYKQTKIANPATYEPAHEESVPPGDCVIVEFAPPKDRTDKLCKQYGVRDSVRCEQFGVPANQRDSVCTAREVK